jgi:drug/metabolite transporter (DMT)-like permease
VAGSFGIILRMVLTTLFWGGTFIAGRFLAQSMPHFVAACLRFCFALVGLGAYVAFCGRRLQWPNRSQWWAMLGLGATGIFAYNAGFFAGLGQLQASRAALIVAASPVLTLCAVNWIQRARWVPRQVLGVLLSFAGALVVVSHGHPLSLIEGAAGMGELFIFGAVLAWVVYTLLLRYQSQGLDALSMTFFSIMCGTLMLAVPAAVEWQAAEWQMPSPAEWAAIAYLGLIGTALSFVWYSQAVAVMGAARTTQYTNLVPFFGVLLSAILLREAIPLASVAGGVMVVGGVMLANRAKKP